MSVTGEPTTAHFAMELGNDPIPLAALPPQEPVRRKRPTQAVAVVALLGALAYLTWRAVATLNLGVWWISLPLIGLEVYAAIGLAVLTTSLWDLDALAPVAKRAGTGQRIAVLIPDPHVQRARGSAAADGGGRGAHAPCPRDLGAR